MKNYIRLIITSLILPFLGGCLEDPEVSIVNVKTVDEIEYVKGGILLKGEIETDNELRGSVESQGFCYSTKKAPTVSDSTIVLDKPLWGEYSAMLSNLNEDTKYYARAFVQNKYGVVYGDVISFTSLTRPKVSTLEVSENDNHELLVSCELLSLGTGDVDLLGICYSIDNSEPILEKDSVKVISPIKKGKYEISYSIKPDSKYYVRAVAQNIAGVSYGSVKEIVTKKQTYTITFDSNDGTSQSNSMKVNSMETNILPENTFVREGYTFTGWNTKTDGSGVSYYDKQSITLNNNITLYAQWRPNSHVIIFKCNGASGNMPSVEIKYNNSYTIPSNTFTYTGYAFIGWNTSTDGTGITYYEDQTITIKSDLTLYAQWEKKSYNITFYSNGGSGSMQSAKVNYLESYVIPTNLYTRTGYKFVGWNTLANGNGTSYSENQKITITGNLTLYAQWKKIEEVQEQVSGSHQGHDYVDLGLPSGTLWATCNVGASRSEGYGDYFAWGETETKSSYTSSNYTYSNNSEVLPLTCDAANVNWGGDWRMPTKTEQEELRNSSYTIWTWTVQNFVTGYRVTSKINGNSIFLPAAGFMSSSLNEVNCYGNYWSSSYDVNYPIGLYFKSEFVRGSSFYSHQGLSVRPVIPVNSSVEPEQPTLYTITFNGNGGIGSMSSMTVNASSSVTLPSNKFTQSGYSFTGWNTKADGSGDSYTNGQSLTLSGDLTLYAQWRIYVSTITLNANDGSGESSSIDVSRSEKVILLNKFVRDGYVFLNWNTEADGSGLSYENAEEIMVAGDLILYAQWRKYDTPKVTTSNVTDITNNSASCSGSIISLDYEIIERGICYSSSSTPTISNYVIKSGAGVGAFTCSLTGLSSGTTYYVRAYAKYSGGYIYGEQKSFTTLYPAPIVTTSSTVSNKTDVSAICSGSVSSPHYTISERGICYATHSNPTTSSNVIRYATSLTGSFSANLTDLYQATTYYYRAYVIYGENTEYGAVMSFTTYSSPKVTTSYVSDITFTSAYCSGTVISADIAITERGVCYSTYSTPTISSSKVISGSGTGSYSCYLSGLSQGVTYYARAYAKYSGGVVYGDIKTFRTKTVPQVSELYLLNKSESSIKCEVDVYSPDFSIIDRGVCYGKYPNPTTYDNVSNSSASTGKHIYNIDGFSEGITYYLRGYVKYEGGIIYGKELQFTFTNSSKLYFIDSQDWDSVGVIYTYIWNSVNDVPGVNDAGIYKWPGVKANLELGTYRGYSIYSFDVSGFNVDYIIFNSYDVSYGNYRYKTQDLKIDLSKPYYYEGRWYGSLSEIP